MCELAEDIFKIQRILFLDMKNEIPLFLLRLNEFYIQHSRLLSLFHLCMRYSVLVLYKGTWTYLLFVFNTGIAVNLYAFICIRLSVGLLTLSILCMILTYVIYICGTAVAQWLRCCDTNRKVAGSIPTDIKSFRSYYGPGVDSASNRNEYQYFLGVKAASA